MKSWKGGVILLILAFASLARVRFFKLHLVFIFYLITEPFGLIRAEGGHGAGKGAVFYVSTIANLRVDRKLLACAGPSLWTCPQPQRRRQPALRAGTP